MLDSGLANVMRKQDARCGLGFVGLALVATQMLACHGQALLGTWTCSPSAAGAVDAGRSFAFPWRTGFENGFCEYQQGGGFCYATGTASYRVVDAPVHAGRYAAAMTVFGDGTDANSQSRCVREGVLPTQAYYGAWYYVPSIPTNNGVWNLVHFQGGSGSGPLHYLWDLSLKNDGNGGLRLDVLDYLPHGTLPGLAGAPAIPVAAWFHVELFLKRASDATGAVAVYQDGQAIWQVDNLITDDSQVGQWYLGNLATDLDPSESTVYVDDVTVRDGP